MERRGWQGHKCDCGENGKAERRLQELMLPASPLPPQIICTLRYTKTPYKICHCCLYTQTHFLPSATLSIHPPPTSSAWQGRGCCLHGILLKMQLKAMAEVQPVVNGWSVSECSSSAFGMSHLKQQRSSLTLSVHLLLQK